MELVRPLCIVSIQPKAQSAFGMRDSGYSRLSGLLVVLAFFANMSVALDLLITCGYQEGSAARALNQNTTLPMGAVTRKMFISFVVLKAAQAHRMVRILEAESRLAYKNTFSRS